MRVAEIYLRKTIRTVHSFEAVEVEPSDPFGIDDPCPMNAGGPHADLVQCHVVSCSRCGRIVWA